MWIRSNDWKFTQDAIPMLTDSPQCLCFGIFVIWWDKNLLSKRVSNILSILVFILVMMLKVNVHVQSFGQSFKIRQRLGLLCFLLASKSGIFNIFSGLRRSRSISGPHFSRAQWLPTWTKGWVVAVGLGQLWQLWQCVAWKDQLGILHLLQILEGNVIWIAWKI